MDIDQCFTVLSFKTIVVFIAITIKKICVKNHIKTKKTDSSAWFTDSSAWFTDSSAWFSTIYIFINTIQHKC